MSQKSKNVLSILFGLLFLVIIHVNSYSRVIGNRGSAAFVPDDGQVMQSETTNTIESLIIKSAGCFLKSQSDYLLLLNKIELSDLQGLDYNQSLQIVAAAIDNMEQARDNYLLLKYEADKTPYNPLIVSRLYYFDYYGYLYQYDLNYSVYQYVIYYLQYGDIRGVFNVLLFDSGEILRKLYQIRNIIAGGVIPENSSLWRLNQYYSETVLFGQYAAEIFHQVSSEESQVYCSK